MQQPSPAPADPPEPLNNTMHRIPLRLLLTLTCFMILSGAVGCGAPATPVATTTPTITQIPTRTNTPTITSTYTPTITTTPAFTITSPPTNTPTITLTPFPTLSPTLTPTQIPPRPAVLFPYQDRYGTTIDWSYTYATQIDYDRLGEVNDLWAFMAFQLLDRGIHQVNFRFQGETITVYYLNVAHEFDGEMLTMQLVLGGTPGANIPISVIPAGGTAYIQVAMRDSSNAFYPNITHREANSAFEVRNDAYPLLFLKDLQAMLPDLPDEIILLANHPILIPRNDWTQVKLDMTRVSFLAARYRPFFELDPFDRLVDQSHFAYALRDHILEVAEMPPGDYAYSSRNLVIITGQ